MFMLKCKNQSQEKTDRPGQDSLPWTTYWVASESPLLEIPRALSKGNPRGLQSWCAEKTKRRKAPFWEGYMVLSSFLTGPELELMDLILKIFPLIDFKISQRVFHAFSPIHQCYSLVKKNVSFPPWGCQGSHSRIALSCHSLRWGVLQENVGYLLWSTVLRTSDPPRDYSMPYDSNCNTLSPVHQASTTCVPGLRVSHIILF